MADQPDPASLGFDVDRLRRLRDHFARHVETGQLAGWQLAITRRDSLAYSASYGWQDREQKIPLSNETLWRIFSMTKPITSVAAMVLWERGMFQLTDPVSRWIPAFDDMRVYQRGSADAPVTVPATEPVRVWHLLSHTSGLTAGFLRSTVVDALYRAAGYDGGVPEGATLTSCVEDWARLPLLFQPGSSWGYGVSSDVLGRLIEIWTGQTLDKAIAELVTAPLGMTSTAWEADTAHAPHLATLYSYDPITSQAVRQDGLSALATKPPTMLSGGGGLLSTLNDYVRFTRMLARGGELDGIRVIAPTTLALMTANHLAGDLGDTATGGLFETEMYGVGFGLGFATVVDPIKLRTNTSPGEYYWGGAASTVFWIDPSRDLTAVFMTQLLPAGAQPLRPYLRQLVYSALVGSPRTHEPLHRSSVPSSRMRP